MTERSAPTQPPLFLDKGRLILYPDGEYQVFMRDQKSWTTGTLDARELAALKAYLPTVLDNVADVYEQKVAR